MQSRNITEYIANDGSVFRDKAACLAHEALVERIDNIMSILPPRPDLDGCRFENGAGYIQHNPTDFIKVKNKILELASEYIIDSDNVITNWIKPTIEDPWRAGKIDPSWAARAIDDFCPRVLATNAWYRLYCTDSQFREWGQPFFASNPTEGTNKQLN